MLSVPPFHEFSCPAIGAFDDRPDGLDNRFNPPPLFRLRPGKGCFRQGQALVELTVPRQADALRDPLDLRLR